MGSEEGSRDWGLGTGDRGKVSGGGDWGMGTGDWGLVVL